MVESLGDYFAAADICAAPVPPPAVISRAVALQGATCALAGMWGTTSGTTAYNEVGSLCWWQGKGGLRGMSQRAHDIVSYNVEDQQT